MAQEWECVTVSATSAQDELLAFFAAHGLAKYGEKLIEVTDAESVDDLKLLDQQMVEQAAAAAGLQIISAKKFQLAIAALRGESPAADAPSSASSIADAGAATAGAATAGAAAAGVAVAAGNAAEGAAAEGAAAAEELDAPSAPAVPAKPPALEECVAICIDRSGSMGAPFGTERTRMEAVKQMFYAFRDRTENVGQGTHQIGLIAFDDKVDTLLGLTTQLDRFEALVDDIDHRGSTAIYFSVAKAVQMLEPIFQSSPSTDLRIVVLTDGQNNAGITAQEALEEANRIGAVVDAIIVGDRPDSQLRKIVNATGGECFQIRDLGEGFELLEAERVVSLRARRGGADKPPFVPRPAVELSGVAEVALVAGTAVQRAPVVDTAVATARVADAAAVVASASSGSSQSQKRVMKEIQLVLQNDTKVWMHSGEGVHIFPSPDNILLWRALIEGPPGSPFEGGVFVLSVRIPDDYPFKPPRVQFVTPVYHCGVSDSGNICLDILRDGWHPSMTVPKAVEAVRLMLLTPDTDYALRQWIAELTIAHVKSGGTDTRYVEGAQQSVQQHASKTVEEWKQEWGC